MEPWERLMWVSAWTQFAFVFAFGAIVGSFLNVVAYRLPQGKGLVLPPSACPACETRLRWNDNIPVLGWLALRGRCRYCRSPISPEYPIVEALVALIFATSFAMWFGSPSLWTLVGVDPTWWKPEWAAAGVGKAWPMYGLVLALVSGLVAITLIDARTFTIPLVIPWVVTGLALVVHPIHAAVVGPIGLGWTLMPASGAALGVAFGGMLGVALSIALVRLRVMPRSFADYDRWEREVEGKLGRPAQVTDEPGHDVPTPGRRDLLRAVVLVGPALALMFFGATIGQRLRGQWFQGMLIGMGLGLVIGLILRKRVPRTAAERANEPIWLMYPHTRREMLKELTFVAPIVLLAVLGWKLASGVGVAPLWVEALAGACLGYLVGGAVVWVIRIMGSLAFGKEAMGLGDVHLMAMVGAVMGWADAFTAFFLGPFIAIAWTVGATLAARGKPGGGSALPFGPHLAAATMLVIFGKPVVELGLSWLMGRGVNLP